MPEVDYLFEAGIGISMKHRCVAHFSGIALRSNPCHAPCVYRII